MCNQQKIASTLADIKPTSIGLKPAKDMDGICFRQSASFVLVKTRHKYNQKNMLVHFERGFLDSSQTFELYIRWGTQYRNLMFYLKWRLIRIFSWRPSGCGRRIHVSRREFNQWWCTCLEYGQMHLDLIWMVHIPSFRVHRFWFYWVKGYLQDKQY